MKNKVPIVSLLATLITLFIGVLVIVGWFIHSDFLRSIVPGAVKMKFNVALGFVFSSIVLLINYIPSKNRLVRSLSTLFSAMVCLIGSLTLAEYIFSLNFGIDEYFTVDELRTWVIYDAGRMSPLSAINFVFIGVGLLLLNKEKSATYQFYYLFAIAFTSVLM